MYEIRVLTDMGSASDFYSRFSVASTAEISSIWRDKTDGYPPALGLMPVERGTVDVWFSGDDRVTLGAYEGGRLVGIASGSVVASRQAG